MSVPEPVADEVAEPVEAPVEGPHVVVVGSGIAGLTAALHALDAGCRVTLMTKDALEHANTRFAQGGIAGVVFADDRVEDHVADTLTAGAGLSNEVAVQTLVAEGPARIRELIEWGVAFDRTADGELMKGLEAAHSYPRVLHAGGDATGLAIEGALIARVRASSAEVIEHAFLVDLAVTDGRVSGVFLLGAAAMSPAHRGLASDSAHAAPELLAADAVVLATGGAGQLYAHTTNPAVATGDGIAAAMRAGAEVRDLEFVQFHPTVLPAAAGAEPFLVSEAVRGEGAILIDERGERFCFAAHPDGELAPRDVVARAIGARMAAQEGRPVRLDATALGAELLARRFPTIDRAVRERGLDWSRAPLPVTPAAHYLMGGVSTDLSGRTSVPGLYAVGEVARTGVHGANRLASNSLLEGAVFGARAGDAIARDAASGVWPATAPPLPGTGDQTETGGFIADRPASDGSPVLDEAAPPFSRAALQQLMWADAGLVRTGEGLRHAASVLARWRRAPRTTGTVADHEDENLLLVAEALVSAALRRAGSVGAHFRSDAPANAHDRVAAVAAC